MEGWRPPDTPPSPSPPSPLGQSGPGSDTQESLQHYIDPAGLLIIIPEILHWTIKETTLLLPDPWLLVAWQEYRPGRRQHINHLIKLENN